MKTILLHNVKMNNIWSGSTQQSMDSTSIIDSNCAGQFVVGSINHTNKGKLKDNIFT